MWFFPTTYFTLHTVIQFHNLSRICYLLLGRGLPLISTLQLILENEKLFKLRNEGYRDGIKRKDTILLPVVGWVTAKMVGTFPKHVLLKHCQSVNYVSCLVALKGFHSLVLMGW